MFFFCGGVFVWQLHCPCVFFSVPFPSGSPPCVTAEHVQINIWRHLEHEEQHCLGSGGHRRIMPMTGNIWVVNSCGECITARGIYCGGWAQYWSRGAVSAVVSERLVWYEVWSYGGRRLVTGDTRWPVIAALYMYVFLSRAWKSPVKQFIIPLRHVLTGLKLQIDIGWQ